MRNVKPSGSIAKTRAVLSEVKTMRVTLRRIGQFRLPWCAALSLLVVASVVPTCTPKARAQKQGPRAVIKTSHSRARMSAEASENG